MKYTLPDPEFKKIDIVELQFWQENPRIVDWIETEDNSATIDSETIKNYFLEGSGRNKHKLDDLAKKIKERGLREELIVNKKNDLDYEVIEGNRRLAAHFLIKKEYEFLNQELPSNFQKISCKVYNSLSEEQIYEITGIIHIEGKKPWIPYNFGLVVEKFKDDKDKSFKQIADIYGKKPVSIEKVYRTIKLMKKYNLNSDKWSYVLPYIDLKTSTDSFDVIKNQLDIDGLEDNLVKVITSDNYKDIKATNLRDTIKKAYKKKGKGRKKLIEFSKGKPFNSLLNWSETTGGQIKIIEQLEKTETLFANNRVKIEKLFQDMHNNAISKQDANTAKRLLKNIKDKCEDFIKLYKNNK